MNLTIFNSTFLSMYTVNMYPLVHLCLIKISIKLFTNIFAKWDREKVRLNIKIRAFCMRATLLSLNGMNYFNTGAGQEDNVALTIVGTKSAFLADLTVSYIFKNSTDFFCQHKIQCDSSI